MDRALWISASGMQAQTRMTESIAHNLANVSTTGYKKGQVHFQDLFYQTLKTPGSTNNGVNGTAGIEMGNGSRVAAVNKNFSQGNLRQTGGELNLAINGDGFFQITMPSGETAYTRDGSFYRDANGSIVTANGYPLVGAPTIPANATKVDISQDGTVSVTANNITNQAGSIQIVRFPNAEGLSPKGDNLYTQTPASGTATTSTPGQNGSGTIRQGFLENSNVEIMDEMVDMISSQRAFEIISKSVKTSDEMMHIVSNLK
ncbi:MAG: hypothetical protein RL095_1527 [Verrucomicrobiota bacterium]|jgi:flagellar basal-body rod protein FlgG